MSKELYNKFYQKHGASVHNNPERFLTTSKLCKGDVLDIACGAGDLADFYKGEYLGIDISDVAITMAQQPSRPNAKFLVVDATKITGSGLGQFDTIVLAEFLEHIENDIVVFENIKKWSKTNTRIIISVPNGDRVPDENHVREFTIPALRKRFSPMGKIAFYNWPGVEQRIIMTIDLGQENINNMALVMMCKNEAMGLERAILSAIEIVDEIVIAVDNKNTDETLKIANRYADVVKLLEWQDDFAKARNFTKEGVKAKWILSLDGHEYIKQYDYIDEALAENVEGLLVKIEMDGGDCFYTNRIFKSYLSWRHAIHNAIKCVSMKKYKGFIIKHDRTGGQAPAAIRKRREQRDEMMERQLKKELRENKNSSRALFYLARWYFTSKKLRKAIKYYKRYLKGTGHKGEMWYCAFEAAISAIGLHKPLLSLKFLDRAEQEVPNRWETAKAIGLTYMFFEHWDKAAEFLVDSFKINTGDFAFYPMQRDDADTWDLIGFCFYQQKEYQKAKIAWHESIEKDTEKDRIKLNKKRIELIDKNLIF